VQPGVVSSLVPTGRQIIANIPTVRSKLELLEDNINEIAIGGRPKKAVYLREAYNYALLVTKWWTIYYHTYGDKVQAARLRHIVNLKSGKAQAAALDPCCWGPDSERMKSRARPQQPAQPARSSSGSQKMDCDS
jgi:hypothetical protein